MRPNIEAGREAIFGHAEYFQSGAQALWRRLARFRAAPPSAHIWNGINGGAAEQGWFYQVQHQHDPFPLHLAPKLASAKPASRPPCQPKKFCFTNARTPVCRIADNRGTGLDCGEPGRRRLSQCHRSEDINPVLTLDRTISTTQRGG